MYIVCIFTNCLKVILEGNFVCLDYQSLKDYFSKTTIKMEIKYLGTFLTKQIN